MDSVYTRLEQEPWFPDVAIQDDFFMHIRSAAFLAIALWMVISLVDKRLLTKERERSSISIREMLPVLVYGALVILSSLLSKDYDLTLKGAAEQYETVWILLAYLVAFFYFCDASSRERFSDLFLFYLLVGVSLQCAIGFTQLAGKDFWSFGIGRFLMLLGEDASASLQFAFTGENGNQVYLSFYNPNYAAVYLLLVLPFAVYGINHYKTKLPKMLCSILSVSIIVCLWGTGSKAGFITASFLVCLMILFLLHSRKRKILFAAVFILAAAGYFIVSYLIPGDSYGEKIIKNIFKDKKNYKLQEINLLQDSVQIKFDNDTIQLHMEMKDGKAWFSIRDEDDIQQELDYDSEAGRFTFADGRWEGLSFSASRNGEELHLFMYWRDIPWEFVKEDSEHPYQYVTLFGKKDTIENAPCAFGEGYERSFSDRMYLWSRTVPLLKDYLLVGSGPNTFSLVFPQNDYVSRANIDLDMLTQIISRPHSMYLQSAVQTGVLSLIALLLFFFRYLGNTVKYRKRENEKDCLVIPCFLSFVGFLIMGITNDSLIVTAPVFWAILGTGYGLMKRKESLSL